MTSRRTLPGLRCDGCAGECIYVPGELVPCHECNGTGSVVEWNEITLTECERCSGTGERRQEGRWSCLCDTEEER